jgi:IPT/TIG domain
MTKSNRVAMHRKWLFLVIALIGIASRSSYIWAYPTATLTIVGAEQQSPTTGVWDTGTVMVTVNGHSETVSYGKYSTPSSIAAGLAVKFSQDCSGVTNARATGPRISFRGRGTVATLTVQFTTSRDSADFQQDSFGSNGMIVPPTALQIYGLTPNVGTAGTIVKISGSNFGSVAGTVTFNGTPAAVSSWGPSTIVVTVPTGTTTGFVFVSVGGNTSNGLRFRTTIPASCP